MPINFLAFSWVETSIHWGHSAIVILIPQQWRRLDIIRPTISDGNRVQIYEPEMQQVSWLFFSLKQMQMICGRWWQVKGWVGEVWQFLHCWFRVAGRRGGDLTEAGVEKEKKKEKKWNLIGCVKHTMWKFEFYAWKQMATYVNDIGRFSNGNW